MKKKAKKSGGIVFHCGYKFLDGEVLVSLEGHEVIRVLFDSENLGKGLYDRMEVMKPRLFLSEEQRPRIYEAVRRNFAERGQDVSDEEIRELEGPGVRAYELKLIRDSIEASKKSAAENLGGVVAAFWEKLLNIATFAAANAFQDLINEPEEKFSEKMLEAELYRIERERLRALTGSTTTRGGAHNVKHAWTDAERACLATSYEALRPIWMEAKRIARDAQKSREQTRKKGWRAEVLRAYPKLPDDLLERLSTPRADDAKPADIAIIHAKRECGVTDDYSPRYLRARIRAWKLKAPS